MWRKAVHDAHGYFDEKFESAGDWEFWLRISKTEKFLYFKEYLGLYLKSPTSIEHRDYQLSRREIQKIRRIYANTQPSHQGAGITPASMWSNMNNNNSQEVVQALIDKADELYQQGHSTTALDILAKGIQYMPQARKLHYTLTDMLCEDEKYQAALKVIDDLPSDSHDIRKAELKGS